MPAPLIGLTTRNTNHPTHNWPMLASPKSYTQALINAGAVPVLIPLNTPHALLPDLLARLDGIVLTGGGDIETSRFNGQPHRKVYDVDPQRDEIEFSLVEQAIALEIPLLGICRGCQVINVALGGTLYTHILDQLDGALDHSYNKAYQPDHPSHSIKIKTHSLLSDIVGSTQIEVNSLHHQGIKILAPGLQVLATAPDGLVEAFRLANHPFGLAVQWHPEWMPDSPEMQAIFSAFCRQAVLFQGTRK